MVYHVREPNISLKSVPVAFFFFFFFFFISSFSLSSSLLLNLSLAA